MEYSEIEKKLKTILEQLPFSDDEKMEVNRFIQHNEFGVALETIVFLCIEESKKLESSIVILLFQMASDMLIEFDNTIYKFFNYAPPRKF